MFSSAHPSFAFGLLFWIALSCHSASADSASRWRDPVSGIEFVRMEQGCFDMGHAAMGPELDGFQERIPRADEVPKHRVCVDAFWLARTELTRGQWVAVMSPAGAASIQHPDRPLTHISWHDAQEFLARLNAQSGTNGRFRLPTETEWEYACWAGKRQEPKHYLGEERERQLEETAAQAQFGYPRRANPHVMEVAGKVPNAWGLHDMLGNVWEWVEDAYAANAYTTHAAKNPKNADGSNRRVIRGGSYKSDLTRVRCGVRNQTDGKDRSPVIGFRLAREIH